MIITAHVGGCDIAFGSYDERIEVIDRALAHPERTTLIGYANAHTVVTASADPGFREALRGFTTVFGDGVGVFAAARFLDPKNMALQGRQNATDFNYRVLQYASEKELKVFFVGGTETVARRLAELVRVDFPGVKISGSHSGYPEGNGAALASGVASAAPDMLIVGMGHPNQEAWIRLNRTALRVPVILTVGGFFNFYTGEMKRAPKFFQVTGTEWLFRMLSEPRRLWRRYVVGIPHFLYIVINNKFRQ